MREKEGYYKIFDNVLEESYIEDILSRHCTINKYNSEYTDVGASTNSKDFPDYRRAKATFNFDINPIKEIINKKATSEFLNFLGIDHNKMKWGWEQQLTISRDKEFYKSHQDNASDATAHRRMSYVFYLCKEPLPFQGGDLIIYEDLRFDKELSRIQPKRNRLVLMNSTILHAVDTVNLDSKDILDSRITINGWIS